MTEKTDKLQSILQEKGRLAVAYSGGIDSHFLLAAALRALGKEQVLAVLCRGLMMPEAEVCEAERLLKDMGADYRILEVDVLAIPEFAENDKRRCYFCKKHLMSRIKECAAENGFTAVADGKNADDAGVYRPGAQAAEEIGIISPLFESGFTKQDIRTCAREWGISIWNKPSQACLASRFSYHTHLTAEKLQRVGEAEKILHDAGFAACRVRVHDMIARIEVPREDMGRLVTLTGQIQKIRELGFSFVTLDLEGIRSGVFD
ncbi:ATP-dependent sacrificial sulfur transferase LarE [Marvinbryantia formatexigens]|nr:ATP-dependent sacrificial sulfur transferase LarE [Marvinbryantia formatexigens]UWO26198.1 ATP-dependent sacrificial sulfur transferase LarE [Marvinbryantia formatexigens DSM 14469]SDG12951.1 uncharacterized protein SAMN05660368_01998 [Marvinbryantia formatexigens]